jgi:hypothetical protein
MEKGVKMLIFKKKKKEIPEPEAPKTPEVEPEKSQWLLRQQ